MSTLPEATITFLTNALNSILDKLEQLSEPVPVVVGNLTTITRVILSGTAVAILLKLYLGRAGKKRSYITNLNDVGQVVEPQIAVAAAAEGTPEYDIIIVGGGKFKSLLRVPPDITELSFDATGTSGCALAARLTENPNINVLLLEAGGRYIINSFTPFGFRS